MAATRRVHMAKKKMKYIYDRQGKQIDPKPACRWTLGFLTMLYCCLFTMLPVKNMEDQTGMEGRPMGVENHLKGLKELSPSLLRNPSLPKKTGGNVYGKPDIQEIVSVRSNAVVSQSGHAHQSTARRKLQEKLDQIYLDTGQSFDGDLWELSDYIPQWMKGMGLKV
jgi:hypothetical protein